MLWYFDLCFDCKVQFWVTYLTNLQTLELLLECLLQNDYFPLHSRGYRKFWRVMSIQLMFKMFILPFTIRWIGVWIQQIPCRHKVSCWKICSEVTQQHYFRRSSKFYVRTWMYTTDSFACMRKHVGTNKTKGILLHFHERKRMFGLLGWQGGFKWGERGDNVMLPLPSVIVCNGLFPAILFAYQIYGYTVQQLNL